MTKEQHKRAANALGMEPTDDSYDPKYAESAIADHKGKPIRKLRQELKKFEYTWEIDPYSNAGVARADYIDSIRMAIAVRSRKEQP